MAEEVELKLELQPNDADALQAGALLRGDPPVAQQRSIYYDTPDHDLAKARLSLRIRRTGLTRIQTIKADGDSSAGLFARSEWEVAVPNDTPVIDDTTPLRKLLGEAHGEIMPAFELQIERQAWDIDEADAIVELVIDRGMVVAGDRSSPVCEVELELKSGDPRALFSLARKLDAVVPVRLGVLTKAQRGYSLIGPAATVIKAERILLTRDMSAAQAFPLIVHECLRHFRLNETLLLDNGQPEPLHQARVALRRLRSALSLFKAMLDDQVGTKVRDDLRWLASELGEARNLDVLLGRAEPGALKDQLETARETAYARVREVLASSRTRALLLNVAEWVMTGARRNATATRAIRDQPAQEFASASLQHLRRQVKKDGRALAAVDDATRHMLRKDAKKLRYAAEFFAGLFDRKRERTRHKRFVYALEGLQEQLGALNDLATGPDVLAKLGIRDAPDTPPVALGSKEDLITQAAENYQALIAAKRFWR